MTIGWMDFGVTVRDDDRDAFFADDRDVFAGFFADRPTNFALFLTLVRAALARPALRTELFAMTAL
jgi:hypothetical protein